VLLALASAADRQPHEQAQQHQQLIAAVSAADHQPHEQAQPQTVDQPHKQAWAAA
jgi:hypothetical protein